MSIVSLQVAVPIRKVPVVFQMDLDQGIPAEMHILEPFSRGSCYEPEVTHVLLRAIREGDTVVDVGANVGFFTILMSKLVGPAGKVYSFEPGRNVLPKLKANLELNKCENVVLIEKPAWHCVEMLTFYNNADSSGGNALWDPGFWWENKLSRELLDKYQVESTTLQTVLGNEPVRLIKVDAEGAELAILDRAPAGDFIVAELNPFGMTQFGISTNEFRNMMQGREYETYLLHPDGWLPAQVPGQSEITHLQGTQILNVLFSTPGGVAEAWPRVPNE